MMDIPIDSLDYQDVIVYSVSVNSSYEVDEEDDWFFDSERDPVEQADVLRKYRP